MSRKLAAAFYAPPTDGQALRDALGVTVRGWGPFPSVEVVVTHHDDHSCALLWFSHNAFLDLRTGHEDGALRQDPALPFANFFRDAAVRAGCEVAFLATHLHQAEQEWLDGRYWMVLGRDATSLAHEVFGLTYFDDEFVLDWDVPRLDGRNVLPGGPGLTFFGGTGWARWS